MVKCNQKTISKRLREMSYTGFQPKQCKVKNVRMNVALVNVTLLGKKRRLQRTHLGRTGTENLGLYLPHRATG